MFFVDLLFTNVMQRTALILITLSLFTSLVYNHKIAHTNNEDFTIYLIRHAEKDLLSDNQIDPPLTKCGVKRSGFFKDLFKETEIEKIYSTNYSRTKNTAMPTALSKTIDIQYYDSSDLKSFSELLINSKQNSLVVGHSNTTPVLAGLLTEQLIGPFDESIYNRVYKIVITKNKKKLFMIETNFNCK